MFAETIKKDIMDWDGSYTQIRMHSGRTDGSYGHHDWINKCGWGFGSYHFHHTLPAHLHPDGICPYGNEKVGSIINPYTGEKINLGTSYFYEGIHYFSLNLVAKALTANDVLGIENDGNSTGVFYACASGDSTLENLGEIFTFSLPEGTMELHSSEFFETSDGMIQLLAAAEGNLLTAYISLETIREYMTKDGYFTDFTDDVSGCWSFTVRRPTVKVKIESPENCDSLRVGDEVTVQADIEHVASAKLILGEYVMGYAEEHRYGLENEPKVVFSTFKLTTEHVGNLTIMVEVHPGGTAIIAETASDTLKIRVETTGGKYITLDQMISLGWTRLHCGFKVISTGNDSLSDDLYSEIERKHRNINENDISKINYLFSKYGITTKKRICAFFAECSAETSNGNGLVERPGNDIHPFTQSATRQNIHAWFDTYTSYGAKYRGAGVIQLTWDYHYYELSEFISKEYGQDDNIVNIGTEYVAMIYPWEAAVFFWDKNNLNVLADSMSDIYQAGEIHRITSVVNNYMTPSEYAIREDAYKNWMDMYNLP